MENVMEKDGENNKANTFDEVIEKVDETHKEIMALMTL